MKHLLLTISMIATLNAGENICEQARDEGGELFKLFILSKTLAPEKAKKYGQETLIALDKTLLVCKDFKSKTEYKEMKKEAELFRNMFEGELK